MDRVGILNRLQYNVSRLSQHTIGIDLDGKGLKQRILKDYQRHGPGKVLEIPRLPYAGNERTIYRDHIARNRPVVIQGLAAEWPCMWKWTPDYLREHYGEDEILITEKRSGSGAAGEPVEGARLKDILDCLEKGDSSRYARFSELLHQHPELLDDIDVPLLRRWKHPFSSTEDQFQIFIGAKGTSTNLHAACAHNLFVQVHGVKHWYIASAHHDPAMSPDVNRSPYFTSRSDPFDTSDEADPVMAHVDHYEFELHAGEILFNPSSFWHHVTNLTGSIGFGYRWMSLNSFLINFTQTLMVITATNPSFLQLRKMDRARFFRDYAIKQMNNGGFAKPAG
ncbi:MAG: cupin-like domain-containing protein [Flavobacteriales bacterium]|nr:cupin-like domain-containing protein [Flavobacteriales bacterium]